MPYAIRRRGSKWITYNPESGKVYGTHGSRSQAEAQRRALYANAPPSEEEKAAAAPPPAFNRKRKPGEAPPPPDGKAPPAARAAPAQPGAPAQGAAPPPPPDGKAPAPAAAGKAPPPEDTAYPDWPGPDAPDPETEGRIAGDRAPAGAEGAGVGVDAGDGSAVADENTPPPAPGAGRPPPKPGQPGQPAGAPGAAPSGQSAVFGQPAMPEPWKPVTAADLGCILEPMDAALLKRLINADGRTPVAPEPAFMQIVKGLPATTYTTDELIYAVRNPRTNRIYGFSPVEQVLTTIDIGLRRQLSQLEFYTAGNVPDMMLGVPEAWNPDQIAQFQAWWDALLAGNTAERRKARFVPGGTTPFPLKDPKIKDEFDDWLARVICFAFSLPYQALVKEVNRATAESSAEQSQADGLEPLKLWWKDVMDELLEKAYDAPDMEFLFADEEISDPKTKADVWSIAVGGKPWAKPSEARKAYGLPPDPEIDAAAAAPPPAAPGMPPGMDLGALMGGAPGEEGKPEDGAGPEGEGAPGQGAALFGSGKPAPPKGKVPPQLRGFQKKPGASPFGAPADKAALVEVVREAVADALVKSAPTPTAAPLPEVRFIRDDDGRVTGARFTDR